MTPTVRADRTPPRYRIQLDCPPSSRWNQVVDDHLQHLPLMLEEAKKLPEPVRKTALNIAENIRSFFCLEYAEELEGIAARSGLSLADVVGFNILYDMMAYDRPHALYLGCTSIVACDEQGRIWHGRNHDYIMGNLLKNTMIIADFYRGEMHLYTACKFVLYVGFMTGQKPGGFTVSLNARYSGTYAENVEMGRITNYRNPVSFLIRETLEKESTFSGAVERLSITPLICPAYIIVGGMDPFEGVVITRDRRSAVDMQRLSEDNWLLVQSNVDHWTKDVDMRSITAFRLLTKMGRTGLNPQSLFGILSTAPVRNKLTTFSGIMSTVHPQIIYDTTAIVGPENPPIG